MRTHRLSEPRPLLIGLALVLLAGLLAVAPGFASNRDWGREIVDTWSFEVGAQPRLAIDLHDANVEVREGAPRRVEVEVELSSNDLERARERYDEIGLAAKGDATGVEIRSRDNNRHRWLQGYGWSITVRVTAPDNFDLDLRTGDGNVDVETVEGLLQIVTGDGDIVVGRASSEEPTLRTGDGEIDVGELIARDAKISTGDGNVTIERLDVERASLNSGDGDLEIDRASGAFDVRTGDGDVRVSFERFDGASLSSGDGDLRIELPVGAGADLDLEGEDVELRVRSARFEGRRDSDEIVGTLEGGGPRLRARSGDGTVVVRAR